MAIHIENIAEGFFHGKYGGVDVIVSQFGTINISKMCKSAGLQLKDWLKSYKHHEYLLVYDKNNGGDLSPPHFITNKSPEPEIREASRELLDKHTARISNKDLRGLTKYQQDQIQGTYADQKISIMVAMWLSPEFAYKVTFIVEEHFKQERLRELAIKDNKIDSLEKLLKDLHNDNLLTHQKLDTTNEKLDKLQRDINEVRDLMKNQKCSNEIIVYYREKGVHHKNFSIRAGELKNLRKFYNDDDHEYTVYANIANAKLALRKAKELGYVPKINSASFVMEETSGRKNIRKFFDGVNVKIENI